MLLAAVARLYGLTSESLWLDEAFSVYVAQQPFDRMIQLTTLHDTHPPLYHTLLHAWLRPGLGEDGSAARLFSVLLGIASVPLVYLLGRDTGGTRVGLAAALLLAVSPFFVWYGQEARMYSLLAFLCLLSVYLLFRALTRGGTWTWCLYTAVTALALYTQLSAVFFALAGGVAVILYLAFQGHSRPGAPETRPRGEVLRPWLISQGVIAGVWLAWLPMFLRQGETYQVFWIDVPTVATVKTLLFELTSAYLPHWRVPFGQELLLVASLALVVIAATRMGRREYVFLITLVVVPVLALYVISQVRPLFISRALIYVLAPYLTLLAAGLMALTRWHIGLVLLGVLVLLNLGSLQRVYSLPQKEQWREAASFVTANATPGELVLFVAADAQLPFDFYARESAHPLQRHGLPSDVFTTAALEPAVTPADLERIDQLAGGRPSLWLVESHTRLADPTELARQHLTNRYERLETREFEGIRVTRYGQPLAERA
jgi:uncharacterized membrane protein